MIAPTTTCFKNISRSSSVQIEVQICTYVHKCRYYGGGRSSNISVQPYTRGNKATKHLHKKPRNIMHRHPSHTRISSSASSCSSTHGSSRFTEIRPGLEERRPRAYQTRTENVPAVAFSSHVHSSSWDPGCSAKKRSSHKEF